MKHSANSKTCTIANQLVAQGYTRSAAMLKAWILVKAPLVESKVAGVTFENRQRVIEHLTRYSAEQIDITLSRDAANAYDHNAIAVMASVDGSRSVCVGYVPRALAQLLAPLLDAGKAVHSAFKEVRGRYAEYMNYGLVVDVQI